MQPEWRKEADASKRPVSEIGREAADMLKQVAARAPQPSPGIAQVFQRLAEDPAVGRKERKEHRLAHGFDVRADNRATGCLRALGIFRIDFDAGIFAHRVLCHVRAGQGPAAAADLDDPLQILWHQPQNVGVMAVVGGRLFHQALDFRHLAMLISLVPF